MKNSFKLLMIPILIGSLLFPLTTVNGTVNRTGYNVTFNLQTFRVIDDYDLIGSGEWHIFLQSSSGGGTIYGYAQEVVVSDGQTGTINLNANIDLNPGATSFYIYIRAAENDGTGSSLTVIDYDRTIQILVSLSSHPHNQWINLTPSPRYDGSNVYYTYRLMINDGLPIAPGGSLATITRNYGQSISFPGITITDEDYMKFCWYDFDYQVGGFQNMFNAGIYCNPFSIATFESQYPSDPGTYTYALRAQDQDDQYTVIRTGTLEINNDQPSLTITNSLNPYYDLDDLIRIDWRIDDYNPDYYTIFVNGTSVNSGSYVPSLSNPSHLRTYYINGLTEGYFNITVQVTDESGAQDQDTRFIEVRERTFTGFEFLTPLPSDDYVNEVNITWSPGVDSWGSITTYDLEFTQNDGAIWYPLVSDLTSSFYVWDTTAMERGLFYKIRITVNGGGISPFTYEMDYSFHLRETHSISVPALTTPPNEVKGEFLVEWDPVVDNWDHEITYFLYYSVSDETTWNILTEGISETKFSWDTTTVSDGDYWLRVVAFDGEDRNEDISDIFTIKNIEDPPTTTPPSTTPPSTTPSETVPPSTNPSDTMTPTTPMQSTSDNPTTLIPLDTTTEVEAGSSLPDQDTSVEPQDEDNPTNPLPGFALLYIAGIFSVRVLIKRKYS